MAHKEQSPQRKTLSTDEMNALGERLARRQRKAVVLPPLLEKKTITGENLERSMQRLYTNSVEHKKKMLEDLDRKAHPDLVKHHTLDQESLEGMFGRLYTASQQHKEAALKKLEKKYCPEKERKTLTKGQIVDSANRLCNASMQTAKEKHAALFEKYVTSTNPKVSKLSPEEIAESANRLCTTKSGSSPGK